MKKYEGFKMTKVTIWDDVKVLLDTEKTLFNSDIIEYLCKNSWYDNGHRNVVSVKIVNNGHIEHSPYGPIPIDVLEIETNLRTISIDMKSINNYVLPYNYLELI